MPTWNSILRHQNAMAGSWMAYNNGAHTMTMIYVWYKSVWARAWATLSHVTTKQRTTNYSPENNHVIMYGLFLVIVFCGHVYYIHTHIIIFASYRICLAHSQIIRLKYFCTHIHTLCQAIVCPGPIYIRAMSHTASTWSNMCVICKTTKRNIQKSNEI